MASIKSEIIATSKAEAIAEIYINCEKIGINIVKMNYCTKIRKTDKYKYEIIIKP
jgi:hypothetical protein